MGSACFARGNGENLKFIENFIKENNLEAKIELIGSRCENKCAKGPNLTVNGSFFSEVSCVQIERILSEELLCASSKGD